MDVRSLPVVAGLAGALVLTGCAASPAGQATDRLDVHPVSVAAAAANPVGELPPCRPGDKPVARLHPRRLTGPAAGTVRSGRVVRAWSIDGGRLTVQAARPSDIATVPLRRAACNLIAGFTPNNFELAGIVDDGSVFGLGRLTVSPKVHHGVDDEWDAPRGVPRYHDRLAWILAVRFSAPSNCPGTVTHAPPSALDPSIVATKRSTSSGYDILAISARTGGAGITYVARAHNSCGSPGSRPPSVARAYEQVSLPWQLRSINPKRTDGTLVTWYATCPRQLTDDGIDVDRDTRHVRVLSIRGYGRVCGPVRRHLIDLQPPTIHSRISRHLVHVPPGAIDNDYH